MPTFFRPSPNHEPHRPISVPPAKQNVSVRDLQVALFTDLMAVQWADLDDRIMPRASRLSVVVLAVLGALWILAANFSVSRRGVQMQFPAHAADLADSNSSTGTTQIVIRTTPPNGAGLGSVVAQLRSSAAFATMLDARLATFGVPSDHITHYAAASLLHIDRLASPLPPGVRICSLCASPHHERSVELVRAWCDDAGGAGPEVANVTAAREKEEQLRALWDPDACGVILDDRPWDVHYDMSKCTWRWVRDVFASLASELEPAPGPFKAKPTGIGLHIRWGDMSLASYASADDPVRPERSTPVPVAAALLRKLRACGVRDALSVYMEWHNDTVLAGLGAHELARGDYRVVDSGDSVADLLDLAANRVLVLDVSSWTVLAHQIASERGLTVVPDHDLFGIGWYDNGLNRVLRWHEVLEGSCEMLLDAVGE